MLSSRKFSCAKEMTLLKGKCPIKCSLTLQLYYTYLVSSALTFFFPGLSYLNTLNETQKKLVNVVMRYKFFKFMIVSTVIVCEKKHHIISS